MAVLMVVVSFYLILRVAYADNDVVRLVASENLRIAKPRDCDLGGLGILSLNVKHQEHFSISCGLQSIFSHRHASNTFWIDFD